MKTKYKKKMPIQTKIESLMLSGLLLTVIVGAALSTGCSTLEPSQEVKEQPAEISKGFIRIPQNPQNKYYGFNIYRGETPQGPFTKVNDEIIPAQRQEETGKPPIFVDEGLKKGKEYYYYIEAITFAGKTERITPVFRVTP